MNNKNCTYCNKYFYGNKTDDKCEKCDEQFKSVLISVTERFGKALKNLADR